MNGPLKLLNPTEASKSQSNYSKYIMKDKGTVSSPCHINGSNIRWAGGAYSNSPNPSSLPLPTWKLKKNESNLNQQSSQNESSPVIVPIKHEIVKTNKKEKNLVEEEDLDKRLEETGFILNPYPHGNRKNARTQLSKHNRSPLKKPRNNYINNYRRSNYEY